MLRGSAPYDDAARAPPTCPRLILVDPVLTGPWLACVRLADYVERPSTVEINGKRVRAYVMRLILPYSHWMALLERARYDDHANR